MKKYFSLSLLACVFALNACGDDGEEINSNANEKCNSMTYENTCKNETTALICKRGKVVEQTCESNQHCVDGSCKSEVNCPSNCPNGCNQATGKCNPQDGCPAECIHGCDETTKQCTKLADWEGNACEDGTDAICRDGFVAKCVSGKLQATACDDDQICENLGGWSGGSSCITPCAASDVGQPASQECRNDSWFTTACMQGQNADGETIYYLDYSSRKFCPHGCDDNGCIKIHPDEFKACSEVNYLTLSNNDSVCSEKFVLRCGVNGVIEAEDCGSKVCRETELMDIGYASCTEGCTHAGDVEKLSCWTIFAGQSQETLRTCTDDGNGNLTWKENTRMCDSGVCDTRTNGCYEPTGNESCDMVTFKNTCNGSNLQKCEYGEIVSEDCTQQVARYYGISFSEDLPATCVPTPNGAACKAACDPNDHNNAGLTCDPSQSDYQLQGDECIPTGSGVGHYWHQRREKCAKGCNSDGNDCERQTEAEGEICDLDTFEETCVDNFRITCESAYAGQAYTTAYKCSGATPVCGVYEGLSECSTACSASDVGPALLTCNNVSQGKQCIQYGNTYFWHMIYEDCVHGCDTDNTCIHFSDSEGKPCDSSSYKSHCEGNYVVQCFNKLIKFLDCSANNLTCASDDIAHAYCLDLCTEEQANVGTERVYCTEYGHLKNETCMMSTKLINFYEWGGSGEEKCRGLCDADEKMCKNYQTNDPCTEGNFLDRCAGFSQIYRCHGSKITVDECTSGTICLDATKDGKPINSDCLEL